MHPAFEALCNQVSQEGSSGGSQAAAPPLQQRAQVPRAAAMADGYDLAGALHQLRNDDEIDPVKTSEARLVELASLPQASSNDPQQIADILAKFRKKRDEARTDSERKRYVELVNAVLAKQVLLSRQGNGDAFLANARNQNSTQQVRSASAVA
jgi:hypothetical protein